jgi:hypothetical protein
MCAILYISFIMERLHASRQVTLQIIRISIDLRSSNVSQTEQKQEFEEKAVLPFVASKRGVYYYPVNCSKAKTLSIKNTLYFKDELEAKRAGYKPHLGC